MKKKIFSSQAFVEWRMSKGGLTEQQCKDILRYSGYDLYDGKEQDDLAQQGIITRDEWCVEKEEV